MRVCTHLPQVLAFLRGGPSVAAKRTWDCTAFAVKYLEHIVFTQKDSSVDKHNELLTLYLSRVFALLKAAKDEPDSSSLGTGSLRDAASGSKKPKKDKSKPPTKSPVRSMV
jgi:hypothetical protein